jgi:hypothetical protein
MPYPGGKHGPGHYVGSGGIIPPPIFPDPVGTELVWNSTGFPGPFGSQQTYTTGDGSSFSLVLSAPANPGRAEFYASDIGAMSGVSNDDPPTAVQQVNYNTVDAASWFDDSGAPLSPWNITVSPSFSGEVFFQVAGLFVLFIPGAAVANYMTSPDGVSWTQRNGPWGSVVATLYSYMSDGVFDFVGAGGELWRTTDGIAWTIVEPSVNSRVIVHAGNNSPDKYWLFGGNAFGSRVESSPTGAPLSFTQNLAAEASLDAAGLVPFSNPFGVAYSNTIGGGTFVLSFNGVGTGSVSNRLAVSIDGVNWTNPGSKFIGFHVRYSGTLGEFVKTAGDGSAGFLLRSGNGTTWTQHGYAGFGTLGQFPSADLLVSF